MEQLNVPFSFQALLVSILCCYVLNKLVRIYLAAHQRRQNARQLECKAAPSYPHLDPILGLDAFYSAMRAVARGHILDEFEDRFKRTCGGVDTFEIKVFGTKEIHTMEPENVRTVLSLKSKVYQHSAARKGAFACFGHGILASDGKEWEISRAMLRPSFHRSEIRNLSALEEHVVNLIACLPKNGQVVDLQPLFLRLTNDTIFEALLGQSTYTLLGDNTDPRNTQMFEAVEYTAYQISIRLRMGRLATILPDRKFSEALAFVHKYVGDYISRALASHEDEKSDRYLFLKEMVKVNPNPNRVHSELLHTLSAGRETTAAVLSVLFYTIPRYPGVLQKLRNEISVNIGNGLPTYENMRNLKYLKWTINETMRLWPVIPINTRVAAVDTVLPRGGGPDGKSPVFVSAGTPVTLHTYALHRREDIWGKDSREFKPERWDTQENHVWNYVPFSRGSHICPGQEFALTEISYTAVRLLQSFGIIEPGDDSEWAEKFTLAVSVKSGCKLRLTVA